METAYGNCRKAETTPAEAAAVAPLTEISMTIKRQCTSDVNPNLMTKDMSKAPCMMMDEHNPGVVISLGARPAHNIVIMDNEQITQSLPTLEDTSSRPNMYHPKKRHRSLIPDDDDDEVMKHFFMSPKIRASKNRDITKKKGHEKSSSMMMIQSTKKPTSEEDYLAVTPFGMPMRYVL